MPTQVQIPTAVSAPAQWIDAGAAPANVQTSDADTSYIATGLQNDEHWWDMTALPSPIIEPVISCNAVARMRFSGADVGAYYVHDGSGFVNVGALTGAYADSTVAWFSLSKANIDGVRCAIKSPSAGSVTGRCTYVHRDVTYLVPQGGFAFLLGLGPLIVIPSMSHLANLARSMGVFFIGDEMKDAWAEIRDRVWPTYFYFGGTDAYASRTV